MDPNTCLEWWRSADTAAERREHRDNLRNWLMGGGFEPQWTPRERAALMRGFVFVPWGKSLNGGYWARAAVPS